MADLSHLESVAQQLAARLREDDPERVWAWLGYELPDPFDWFQLCFVLACAVPDNQRWSRLTEWTDKYAARGYPQALNGRPQASLPAGSPSAKLAADLLVERFGPRSQERAA